MKTLVLGGTGFLGHTIVLDLVTHGYEVTVCTRGLRKSEFADAVAGLSSVVADKSDPEVMKELLDARYEVIIDTVPSPASLDNILRFAKGLKHYLHCSSTALYTPLPFIPCDETAPYHLKLFPKGSDKVTTDREAMRQFQENGFPATVLRPCCICAPGCYPLDNLGNRRPTFALDIAAGGAIDVVNDGQALFQPIHISDLAASFRLAVENRRRSVGQCYNICQDKAVTLTRYFEIMYEAFGKEPRISYLPIEKMLEKYGAQIDEFWLRFHAMHMCFSIEKATRDLGYHPHITTEEVIADTIRWAYEDVRKKSPQE